MSRIAPTFERLRAERRAALMPFVVAGHPDLPSTARAVQTLEGAGADLIELGVPFSDPVADGLTNQRAYQRALAAGVTPPQVLDLVRDVRGRVALPVVLLSYYNPLLQYGLGRFCRDAVSAGVDGLVVPDLPPDEAADLRAAATASALDTIFLLSPTSTDARIRLAAERSSGFIYCVSLTGVTGARDRLSSDVEGLVARIKQVTSLPVCVGFGVSTPEQVRQVATFADGVIIGSAIVALLDRGGDGLAHLGEFASSLRAALDGVRVGEGAPP